MRRTGSMWRVVAAPRNAHAAHAPQHELPGSGMRVSPARGEPRHRALPAHRAPARCRPARQTGSACLVHFRRQSPGPRPTPRRESPTRRPRPPASHPHQRGPASADRDPPTVAALPHGTMPPQRRRQTVHQRCVRAPPTGAHQATSNGRPSTAGVRRAQVERSPCRRVAPHRHRSTGSRSVTSPRTPARSRHTHAATPQTRHCAPAIHAPCRPTGFHGRRRRTQPACLHRPAPVPRRSFRADPHEAYRPNPRPPRSGTASRHATPASMPRRAHRAPLSQSACHPPSAATRADRARRASPATDRHPPGAQRECAAPLPSPHAHWCRQTRTRSHQPRAGRPSRATPRHHVQCAAECHRVRRAD